MSDRLDVVPVIVTGLLGLAGLIVTMLVARGGRMHAERVAAEERSHRERMARTERLQGRRADTYVETLLVLDSALEVVHGIKNFELYTLDAEPTQLERLKDLDQRVRVVVAGIMAHGSAEVREILGRWTGAYREFETVLNTNFSRINENPRELEEELERTGGKLPQAVREIQDKGREVEEIYAELQERVNAELAE